MYYVGIDVHWNRSTVCILDGNGAVVKRQTIHGGWDRLVASLKEFGGPMSVCYEASCGYGALYDRLAEVADRVVVAHPGKLRLIFKSKQKNDRIDAKKLAVLLMLEELPTVHVPSQDVRSWRRLITYRESLVQRRSAVMCTMRTILRRHGIRGPKSLWTRAGRSWLRDLILPDRPTALERDQLLDEFEDLSSRIKELERELNRIGSTHPGVVLLQSIPGVGIRTAEAVVAYIDRPERFRRSKQVTAYMGLAPQQDQSGPVNRLGHITKEGPGTVRRLLVEAAWQAKRRSPKVQRYFERISRGKPDRKKIALVATANYLLRAMHAMLCSGEMWRDDEQLQEGSR